MNSAKIITSAQHSKFKQLLKKIKSAKGPWYHKHFPGYFYFLFTAGEGFFKYPKWAKSWLLPYGFCFSKDDYLDWYWNISLMVKSRKKLIDYINEDPKRLTAIRREFGKIKRRSNNVISEAEQQSFTFFDNSKLVKLLNRLYRAYHNVYGIGAVSEVLLTTGESDWLKDMIANDAGDKINPDQLPEIVGYLAAPVTPSAVNNANLSLLNLAVNLKRRQNIWRLLRLGKIKQVLKIISKHHQLSQQLQSHTDNYYWIENSYAPRAPITAAEFLKTIADWAKQNNDVIKELRLANNLHARHISDKKRWISKLKLNKDTVNTIRLSDLMTEIHDYRKESVLRFNGLTDQILRVIAKRTKTDYKILLFATAYELEDLLLGRGVDQKALRARGRGNVFLFTPGQSFIIYNKDIPEFKRQAFMAKNIDKDILRGVVASQGKARGTVRVLRTRDQLSSFKAGDILVTNNTTPEFVPAMKRAAAIITEQGGLTTHAAIVSRELGVPCIIGVTNVTDILKTGNKVTVDAITGVITKA